jgi:hypothetical protein
MCTALRAKKRVYLKRRTTEGFAGEVNVHSIKSKKNSVYPRKRRAIQGLAQFFEAVLQVALQWKAWELSSS